MNLVPATPRVFSRDSGSWSRSQLSSTRSVVLTKSYHFPSLSLFFNFSCFASVPMFFERPESPRSRPCQRHVVNLGFEAQPLRLPADRPLASRSVSPCGARPVPASRVETCWSVLSTVFAVTYFSTLSFTFLSQLSASLIHPLLQNPPPTASFILSQNPDLKCDRCNPQAPQESLRA